MGESLKVTGELTCPAIVRVLTQAIIADDRQDAFWYIASWNLLMAVLSTHYAYQQIPLFVKVLMPV